MKIAIRNEKDSTFIALESPVGLRLELSTLGAGIRDVTFLGRAMALTPKSDEDYLYDRGEFYGKTIGPVAGRLDQGKFPPLEEFSFPVNPKNNVTLHSETWDYAFLPFAYEIKEEKEATEVRFTLKVEACKGYPADVEVEVTYRVYEEEARFDLEMKATPSRFAPLHLTNHVYWALDGENMGEATLLLRADQSVSYDERLIPLKRVPVDSALDYRKGKKVEEGAKVFDGTALGGLDHAFFCPSCTLGMSLLSSKTRLDITTSGKGFQIYSFNFPPKEKVYTISRSPEKRLAITSEPILDPSAYQEDFLATPDKPFRTITSFAFANLE